MPPPPPPKNFSLIIWELNSFENSEGMNAAHPESYHKMTTHRKVLYYPTIFLKFHIIYYKINFYKPQQESERYFPFVLFCFFPFFFFIINVHQVQGTLCCYFIFLFWENIESLLHTSCIPLCISLVLFIAGLEIVVVPIHCVCLCLYPKIFLM